MHGQDEIVAAKPEAGEAPAEMQATISHLPVLVLWVGGGARFRNIRLDVGDRSGGSEERQFETGPYFDLGWHLLLRPGARRSPHASVRAIALQVDGGSGIGLRVEPAGSGISLQTHSWRILGQFGYLYPMNGVQVGGLVGVGADVLRIDLNSVLPSSKLVYVRVGPAVIVDLVRSYLGLRVDLGLRVPFVLSGFDEAFGDDASGLGMDTMLTLRGRLPVGFSYGFRLIWEYYRLRFSGSIADVPANGNGAEGADYAINLQLLFGWSW